MGSKVACRTARLIGGGSWLVKDAPTPTTASCTTALEASGKTCCMPLDVKEPQTGVKEGAIGLRMLGFGHGSTLQEMRLTIKQGK